MFLNWINDSKKDNLKGSNKLYSFFQVQEREFLFKQIICPAVTKQQTSQNQ